MELIDFVRIIADEDTALPWEISKLHTWFTALAKHEQPDQDEAWASLPEIGFTSEKQSDGGTRVYVHDNSHHKNTRLHFFDVGDKELADIVFELNRGNH